MLTGQLPFRGATLQDYHHGHAHVTPPDPREFADGVPPQLAQVFYRCVAKSAGDRYPSFAALLKDIEDIQTAPSDGSPGGAPSNEVDGRGAETHLTLALALYNIGFYGAARGILAHCRAKGHVQATVYRLIGNCFREEGDLDAAERHYQKALDLSASPSKRLLLDQGILQFRKGELEHAREQLAEAAGEPQCQAEAYFWLARISYFCNDFARARQFCDLSLQAAPDFAPALLFTPQIYGITELEASTRTSGYLWGENRDMAPADHVLETCQVRLYRALAMHASHPRALIHMAECLWQVGRGDRAKQFLAEAGRLDHVHGYIRRKAWLHGPCEGPPQSSEGALHRAVCALSTKEAEVCLEWVSAGGSKPATGGRVKTGQT
jgi:tetratricopeptide (TPR) repeat protein